MLLNSGRNRDREISIVSCEDKPVIVHLLILGEVVNLATRDVEPQGMDVCLAISHQWIHKLIASDILHLFETMYLSKAKLANCSITKELLVFGGLTVNYRGISQFLFLPLRTVERRELHYKWGVKYFRHVQLPLV